MRTRVTSWMMVLGLAFGVGAVTSWAQDPAKPKDKAIEKAKEKVKEEVEKKLGGDKTGAPTKEAMDKMMEQMIKDAAPGPEHVHFKTLVGKWDVTGTFFMPGVDTPSHSTGTAEYKLILDGRFVVEDLHAVGVEDKQPFSGYGISGFDKNKGKYVGTWMDSMGTGISTSEGTLDPSGKIMTSTLEGFDCMTKQSKKSKMTEEKVAEDKFVMKMYDTIEGQETMTMEVTYTRKK